MHYGEETDSGSSSCTFLAVGGDVEVRLDIGDETRVDGVEDGVGQRHVARRAPGTQAIQLTEDADTTTDVRRVMDASSDPHPTVLCDTNDNHLVV